MNAGWLTDFTNWLLEQLGKLWEAFVTFITDMVLTALEVLLDLFATALEALPVPDFMSGVTVGSLLGQAGPTVMWLVGTFQLDYAGGMIASAYTFRALRKAVTMGKW